MKIAILTEILSTHSGSRAPIELAKHLSSDNEVTLLAYSFLAEEAIKKELEKTEAKVVLIDIPKIPFGKWLAAFKFLPHLKGNDIISFHGTLPSFLVAKLSGIPLVETYYGTQLNAYLERFLPHQKPPQHQNKVRCGVPRTDLRSGSRASIKDKFLNWLGNQLILSVQKIYFGLSSQVVAISKYTSYEAEKLYNKKIPFIHLGASPLSKTLYPRPRKGARPPRGFAPYTLDPITILSVSRITPYKGFHLLIEAVKNTGRKVNLFIVGSASQPRYLAYLQKIKTPQTKILVDISNRQLANLYQNCDIYASCDRYLFFGLTPLEAALFEKPSVILDYCAASEIVVHQKTGFVAKDLGEFTKCLKTLIDNPTIRTEMGQEAKFWAEKNFSWEKTAHQYQQLFARLRSSRTTDTDEEIRKGNPP